MVPPQIKLAMNDMPELRRSYGCDSERSAFERHGSGGGMAEDPEAASARVKGRASVRGVGVASVAAFSRWVAAFGSQACVLARS